MKNTIKILVIAMTLVLVLVAFAGCEFGGECQHEGGTATCEAKAICAKCGVPYGETLKHDPQVTTPAKAPTCTDSGYTEVTACRVCGELIASAQYVAPLGHSFSAVAGVDPTCTEDGYSSYKKCGTCGLEEGKRELPASHSWVEDETNPAKKTCSVCELYRNFDFAGGLGTATNPYLIETPEQMMNISKYYGEYLNYKVADGVKSLDMTGLGRISLSGNFDGNGVSIINLSTSLFEYVGYNNEVAEIKISNVNATMYATDGRAFVRNIFNGGKTTFENIKLDGYLEGLYNMGSFYNYGTSNIGGADGVSYTVEFINSVSDLDIVCTSGNVAGGFLGHSYEGTGNSFTLIIDDKSDYTGTIRTTTGKGHLYFAMTSDYYNANNHFIIAGEEVKFDNGHIPAAANLEKITVVAPAAGEDGYYITPVEGATSLIVYLTAQVTAYEGDEKVPNLAGMTWPLGSETITEFGADPVKVFDLIKEATLINGTEYRYCYMIEDGVLTIYSGRSANYCEGTVRLQVAQYDAEGNLLATGTLNLYSIERPVESAE